VPDSITPTRRDLELADEALSHAEFSGAPAGVLEDLAVDVADAEAAYFRACTDWEPLDVSGVIAANGLVYSDADPGL
jgi:hypothetical protein